MEEPESVRLAKELLAYCEQAHGQRFWQAVTNWAGLPYVGWAEDPSGKNFRDLWHSHGKVK